MTKSRYHFWYQRESCSLESYLSKINATALLACSVFLQLRERPPHWLSSRKTQALLNLERFDSKNAKWRRYLSETTVLLHKMLTVSSILATTVFFVFYRCYSLFRKNTSLGKVLPYLHQVHFHALKLNNELLRQNPSSRSAVSAQSYLVTSSGNLHLTLRPYSIEKLLSYSFGFWIEDEGRQGLGKKESKGLLWKSLDRF